MLGILESVWGHEGFIWETNKGIIRGLGMTIKWLEEIRQVIERYNSVMVF